jgi:hypothetical protein
LIIEKYRLSSKAEETITWGGTRDEIGSEQIRGPGAVLVLTSIAGGPLPIGCACPLD